MFDFTVIVSFAIEDTTSPVAGLKTYSLYSKRLSVAYELLILTEKLILSPEVTFSDPLSGKVTSCQRISKSAF